MLNRQVIFFHYLKEEGLSVCNQYNLDQHNVDKDLQVCECADHLIQGTLTKDFQKDVNKG